MTLNISVFYHAKGPLLYNLNAMDKIRVSRELEKISGLIRERQEGDADFSELYAAQQALAWALNPNVARSPSSMILSEPLATLDGQLPIMDIQAAQVSCQD